MMKLSLAFGFRSGVALLWAVVAGANAFAFTVNYVVDSTGDGDRVACINGVCNTDGTTCNDGTNHCTLRAAIEASNLHSGTDTITFNIPTSDPNYIKSTIVAGNFGGPPSPESLPAPDVYGAFNSSGFNLIGQKDGSTGFTAATDKKGTIASPLNPKLDPKGLRSNGGPTQTVALMSGSPAIDKGTSAGLTGTLTTDQRGFARTVDNNGIPNPIGGDGTDIGAYEFGAQ